MSSNLNETIIESKNDMTHNSSCGCSSVQAAEKQCNQLKYFKEFLHELTKDAVTNEGGGEVHREGVSCNGSGGGGGVGVELRPFIITRSNNESYVVGKKELSAELIMCIWQWLGQKKCPEHFRLAVAHLAEGEIENELKNKKIQEDLRATGNIKNSEDSSDDIMLDLLKLQKFIQQQLEKILLRLCDNCKEDDLKNFADCIRDSSCKCPEMSGNKHPPYVEAHVKNKPRKMEDRHICLPQFSKLYQIEKCFSFYGVFDGHSGSLAATYATTQIAYLVAQQLKSITKSCTLDARYIEIKKKI